LTSVVDISESLVVVRGGGESTRKMIVATLVICMFAFMTAFSVPAVRADRPLMCSMEADLVMEPLGWVGTVAGDITGSIVIVENPATFPGTTEHFDESFTITTTDGIVIKGYDLGVFNLKMFKFVANGMVTEVTSPDLQWLVGYELHFSGSADLTVTPWHASGTFRMMAP
jgi:hypothetical protein